MTSTCIYGVKSNTPSIDSRTDNRIKNLIDYQFYYDKIDIFKENLSKISENELAICDYLNFVITNSTEKVNGKTERHHILPKKLFPHLEKEKWNLVNLSMYDHFVAHYMLLKIENYHMLYAFNMMNRIKKKLENEELDEAARMYQEHKEAISELFSKLNKGRKMSQENRGKVSERTKNTVVVKDTKGEIFRVSKDDEKYISGELVYYRTGIKHKESTIEKMKYYHTERRESGAKLYTNIKTSEEKFFIPGQETAHFILGSVSMKSVATERFTGDNHYINSITGETCRRKTKPKGEGWNLGRKEYDNFFATNIRVTNLLTKETYYVNKDQRAPEEITPTAKVFIYNGTYAFADIKKCEEIANIPYNILLRAAFNKENEKLKITKKSFWRLSESEKQRYGYLLGSEYGNIDIVSMSAAEFVLSGDYILKI